MGSDRARISYDATRKWRGLVAQQGRVTVEADWNEASAIQAAEDRAVILDVVGPVGTPNGGYAVSAPAGPPGSGQAGLSVGPGTLYLGGERLDLAAAVDVAHQPDWLDPISGTLWVAPTAAREPAPGGNELVYLLAIEQEVSALEDPALADVALGGPDTMQRLRVLQRFVRWSTEATTCTQAWSEVQQAWDGMGLTFDAASMRLHSRAALEVGFVTDPPPPSACQPVATGGYLGAENQLIRVQIASVDEKGVPTIVWGFDDATYLYELTTAQPDNSGGLVLTLAKPPVDNFHNPVTGQAVELLRDAASLTPADPSSPTADGFIAAAAGPVFALSRGYDVSSGTVSVVGSLPAGYQDAKQLYLRVWQSSMPVPAGTPVTLAGAGATTGVTVTLSSSGGFHPGDYWCFAVRPSVPNLIYPARYGVAPQPPEGARVLACPIALVTGASAGTPAVSSCIPPFDNLVELTERGGGCCTVQVSPADLAATSLETLLARCAGARPITVCFAPGTYRLTEPLVFDSKFDGISLEACGGGPVVLTAAGAGPEFLLGLIVLQGVTGATIRGIELVQPLVSFAVPENAFGALSANGASTANQTLLEEFSRNLLVGIGIYAHNCAPLVIEDCNFSLEIAEGAARYNIFAAGILASDSVLDSAIRHCTFSASPNPTTVPFYDLAAGNKPAFPYHLSMGYLQVPVPASAPTPRTADLAPEAPGPALGLLHDTVIEDCRFVGVTVPVLVVAQLGTIRVTNTTVQDCYAGLWLVSMANSALAHAFDLLPAGDTGAVTDLASVGLRVLGDAVFVLARNIALVLPANPPAGGRLVGRAVPLLDSATLSAASQGLRALLAQAARDKPTTTVQSSPASAPAPPAAPSAGASSAGPTAPTVAMRPPNVPPQPNVVGPTPAANVGSAGITGADLLMQLPVLDQILSNAGASAPAVPPASDTGTLAVLRLALAGSQVDAVVPNSYSGAGLLVIDLTRTPGSALLNGNRIRNRFPAGAAAAVFGLADVAVTGNIIANEVPLMTSAATIAATTNVTNSLILREGTQNDNVAAPVAVVGNVFVDPPILPSRPGQLPSWVTLNTMVPSTGA